MSEPAKLVTPSFVLVTISSFAYFLAVGASLPVLPRFTAGPLGGGDVAVGIVAGAFSISAIVARPFAGRVGDTHGRRVLIVAGSALVAVSTLPVPFAEAIGPGIAAIIMMIGIRLVQGLGEAMLFTGATTMVNDLAPDERRGEAVSLFTLSLYGGLAFGAVLGEWVLDAFGYTAVWLTIAGLAGFGGMLAIRLRETRPDEGAAMSGGRLVHPAALASGVVMAASVWAFAGFNAFLPLYATETLELGGAGLVYFVYSIVIVAIRLVGRRIPDVVGPKRAAAISLAVSAAGLVLVAAFRSVAGLYAGAIVFAAGQALAFPALMTIAVSNAPKAERGAAIGTFTAFVDIGFGIGPIVSGLVADWQGYPGVFVTGAVAAAFGLVLLRGQHVGARREAVA